MTRFRTFGLNNCSIVVKKSIRLYQNIFTLFFYISFFCNNFFFVSLFRKELEEFGIENGFWKGLKSIVSIFTKLLEW